MDKKNGALLSVFSNSFLIIMKLTVGLMIGSVSVISEAIHSSIDLAASFIAYFSIKESIKESDEEHNFGHAKIESVSAFVEALLILLAGVLIIIEAVKKITSQHIIESINIGIIVMLISSAVNFFISRLLLSIARKQNSIALEADAYHLLTDVYTSAGVMAGLLLIKYTGIAIWDIISAVIVAVIIIKTSIKLIKDAIRDLIDTKIKDTDINKIINIINNHSEIKSYHRLRTRKAGNMFYIDVHIKMDRNITLEKAHSICQDIENKIKNEYPMSHIVLHAEPYKED